MNLESIHNEIYQKIGKNIMLFQKLEHILKDIIHFNSFKAYGSQLQEENNKLKDSISIKSMGQLIKEFSAIDEISPTPKADVSKEMFISTHIEIDTDLISEKSKTLKKLLEERNQLVHHAYLEFNMDTVIGCTKIIDFLDNQQVRIKNEINALVPIVKRIEEFKKKLSEVLKSDEFKEELLYGWIKNSDLVIEIIHIFQKTIRKDGWASFSVLGREIRKTALEEVNVLKEKYQCKSLKELLIKTKMFDFHLEGTSLLYKIKSEYLKEIK